MKNVTVGTQYMEYAGGSFDNAMKLAMKGERMYFGCYEVVDIKEMFGGTYIVVNGTGVTGKVYRGLKFHIDIFRTSFHKMEENGWYN